MQYDKPFKTYSQQIEILKSRGITVYAEDKLNEHILSTVSYYSLINGYKEELLDKRCNFERFKKEFTIERLYNLHLFDSELQGIVFKYVIAVENSLKTKLSYLVARDYGVHQDNFLDKKHYKNPGSSKADLVSGTISSIKKELKNTKNNPTKFYRDGDAKTGKPPKNHIPPWIIIKNIYFSTSVNWYKILKGNKKDEIVNQMLFSKNNALTPDEKKELFAACLRILHQYRNNTAHGNRSITLLEHAKLPRHLVAKEYGTDMASKNDGATLLDVLIATIILSDDVNRRRLLNEISTYLKLTKKHIPYLIKYLMSISKITDKIISTLEQIDNPLVKNIDSN